jgi:hypothetical protein
MSQPPPPRPASQRPPPIPPQAINYPPPPARNTGREDYQRVADTVGMVPSLRWKDNLIQGISIVAGVGIGAGTGALIAREAIVGAFVGGIIGLVAALFISGIVLMILGMMRAKRRH